MKNEPLLSVIVPMFNTEKYIRRFIDSILNQTYRNWEMILVDDGSTDNTVSIVEAYAKLEKRIILKKRDRDPKCADTCRNIGQQLAKGKYIIIFDSDDIVMPFCFQQRVEYMENNPDIEFATFMGESVIADSDDLIHTGKIWGTPTTKDVLKAFLEADYPYAVWNNIYKLESIKEQQWDEKIKVYQDFDYIITTILNKKEHAFVEVKDPDYLYCIGHPNAITAKYITPEKFESTKYLFRKTIDRLNNNNISHQYICCFEKFFLLQYERIALTGNKEQLKDFSNFYCDYYSRRKFRIKLCTSLLNTLNLNTTKHIMLVIYLTLFQDRVMTKIKTDLKRLFGY